MAAVDPTRDRLTQALSALADVQIELDRERLGRQESEDLFNEVVESMSDALLLVDRRGIVWRANGAAGRLRGEEAAALVGRSVRDVLGPDVPATPWELFERTAEGRMQGFEAVIERADGVRVPVGVSCAVVRDRHGKVDGAVYAARDLSETQRLARELALAEARWRLLAEVAELLNSELEPREGLPRACSRIEQVLGCDVAFALASDGIVETVVAREELLEPGAPLASLSTGPVSRRSALWSALTGPRVVHAPSVRPDFPLFAAAPGGSVGSAAIVPLEARGAVVGALVLAGPEGAVGEDALGIAQEVADRVALVLANARLRASLAAVETAREADRLREELIASISHDMQTPLSALIGSASTLKRRPELRDAERERFYDVMMRQATSLRRLVQQFLDYTRLEVGRPLVIRTRAVDVAAVVEEVVHDFELENSIEVDVEDGLPPVGADPDRLNQVLANLLGNAIKFSPPGSPVKIVVRRTRTGVEISVADRGRGIGPADLAHLFEKFYRGSGAADVQGTGIGLYVSRAIVEAQDGRLTVSSRLGEGSRFTVALPAASDGLEQR